MSGQSISQRAVAASNPPGVKEMPEWERPISELFRLAALEYVDADAAANLLEEMKTPTLEKLKSDLIDHEGQMADNRAERIVKSSDDWAEHIKKIVEARTKANRLKMELEFLRIKEREQDRMSWLQRTEHKMGRQAT